MYSGSTFFLPKSSPIYNWQTYPPSGLQYSHFMWGQPFCDALMRLVDSGGLVIGDSVEMRQVGASAISSIGRV